jgi:hypothetical protein
MVGLQTCLFDASPPPGPTTLPNCPVGGAVCGLPLPLQPIICTLQCFAGRVPLVQPLMNPIISLLLSVFDIFNLICGQIASLFAQLASILSQIGNILDIIGDLGGGDFLPSFFIKQESNHLYMSSQNLEDEWEHTLISYNVSNSTTCGKILWSQNPNQINQDHWGNYAVYYTCLSLFKIGITYEQKYPDDLNKNEFLNMSTLKKAFNFTYSMAYEEMLKNITEHQNDTQKYSFQNLRSMPYNIVPEDMKFHKMVADREPIFQKMFGPVSSSSIIDEEYEKLPENQKVSFMNLIEGIWNSFKNTTYYDIIKGYQKDHNYLKNAMLNRHGWYPGMRGKKRPISKENNINTNNAALNLMEKSNTLQSSDEFYSKENAWNRKKEEQDFVNAINGLYLRFSTAMINEYKMNGPKRPWYTYKDSGKYGNPDLINPSEHQLRLLDDRVALKKLKTDYETELQSYDYKIYTEKDMKETKQNFQKNSEFFSANINLAKTVYDKIAGDGTFTERMINRYDIKYWPSVQKFAMFSHVIRNNDWENLDKVSSGEKGYLVDEGFVSSEKYMKTMESKTFRKRGSILDLVTGQYNPREPNEFGFLLTDPGESKHIPSLDDMRSVWVRQQRQRLMLEKNITNFLELNSTQRQAIISFNDPVSDVVFSFIEFCINDVIGGIFRFFGLPFHNINIVNLINDFLGFFVSDDIPGNVFNNGKTFVKKFFKNCNVPEDFNGTNLYNPVCWPILDETVFHWVHQGNASLIPIQIPWPKELINKQCKNVYNGKPGLFDPWAKSDNCKIDSNSSIRPFCDTSTCDYCERSYFSCSSVAILDIFDSFFYLTGVLPPLLDEFFRGGLPIKTTKDIVIAFFTPVVAMTFTSPMNLLTLVWTYVTQGSLIIGWLEWTMDVVFDSYFPGPGGGLPWGVLLYIILIAYVILGVFFPIAFKAVEPVLYIILIPALIWSVNFLLIGVGSGGIPSFNDNFNINRGISKIALFFNEAPTPLKYLSWTWLSNKADRFTFSSLSDIPSVDTFCFFWTMDNIALMVFFGFFVYSMILFLWAIFVPIGVYFLGIFAILLNLLRNIRLWRTRQDVNELGSWKEEVDEKFKALNSQLKFKLRDLKNRILTQLSPSTLLIPSFKNTNPKDEIISTSPISELPFDIDLRERKPPSKSKEDEDLIIPKFVSIPKKDKQQ